MSLNPPDACESSRDIRPEMSELELERNIEALREACGEETYQKLHYQARRQVKSADAADDIVQQAYTNTLVAMERGVQIDNMGGFLYQCVRNLCVNHVLREPKALPVENLILTTERSAAAKAELRYRWQKIEDTVDQMPSSQRSVFLLAEVKGLNYGEIAELMNRSTNSVRQLLNRAREKVRAKADIGSDWVGIPAPAIEMDRLLVQGHTDLSPTMLDRIEAKASQLQAWLGNVFQSSVDGMLHPTTSVLTGAVVVALAITSPAPPNSPVAGDTAPVANRAVDSAPLALHPRSDSTGTRIDELVPVSTMAAPQLSSVGDRSGAAPNRRTDQNRPPRKHESDESDPTTNIANTPAGEQGQGTDPVHAVVIDPGENPEESEETGECSGPGECAERLDESNDNHVVQSVDQVRETLSISGSQTLSGSGSQESGSGSQESPNTTGDQDGGQFSDNSSNSGSQPDPTYRKPLATPVT